MDTNKQLINFDTFKRLEGVFNQKIIDELQKLALKLASKKYFNNLDDSLLSEQRALAKMFIKDTSKMLSAYNELDKLSKENLEIITDSNSPTFYLENILEFSISVDEALARPKGKPTKQENKDIAKSVRNLLANKGFEINMSDTGFFYLALEAIFDSINEKVDIKKLIKGSSVA